MTDTRDLSFDEFDELQNPRDEATDFEKLTDAALARRSFMKGGLALGLGSLVLGASMGVGRDAMATSRLAFKAISTSTEDTIKVPEGYNWQVVVRWGDPLWSKGTSFDHTTRGTGESQELAFGDNNDGMALFTHEGRNILVVNNEYTNTKIIYSTTGGKPETADDIRKGKAAHGLSVVELSSNEGYWSVVRDSKYNRRITADSPMEITGPARGHDLLKTAADPTGTQSLGTWNNCGNGRTPWGTYLACEENFNGYFASSDETYELSPELKRYGVGLKDWGYGWSKEDVRFDVSKNPNEPNRAGYIVEVDPLDPTSTPKKRTALGRFKHENAEVVLSKDGKVIVYLGDDERGEFLYRFVSSGTYVQGGDNRDLLETGTLYAAKFHENQKGEWLKLTPETTGMKSEAEICIHTRIAASAVGATTMDRPEWVAANPHKAEVYCALTNNKNRGIKPNAGGDATPVGGPNPREKNLYGQIVRWQPADADHGSDRFTWDLFAMAGNPAVHQDLNKGSANITAENMFNSPDGMAFDSTGLLWIQTDGNYSNAKDFAGQGNNQMLCADPETGEIKRFLVGPKECEITGSTWSADKRTMFIGVQHPGEKGNSQFPDGEGSAPRSAVIAITKKDGSVIG